MQAGSSPSAAQVGSSPASRTGKRSLRRLQLPLKRRLGAAAAFWLRALLWSPPKLIWNQISWFRYSDTQKVKGNKGVNVVFSPGRKGFLYPGY